MRFVILSLFLLVFIFGCSNSFVPVNKSDNFSNSSLPYFFADNEENNISSSCFGICFTAINLTEDDSNLILNMNSSSIPLTYYFFARNDYSDDKKCFAVLNLSVGGVSNTSRFDIGVLSKSSEKLVKLNFDLPNGNSSFSLSPDCVVVN